MQLILVRHGEPLAAEVARGSRESDLGADPGLSETGHAQAGRLASWVAARVGEGREDVAEVVVSPMTRARETAEPVAAALGVEVSVAEDLAEYDRGHHVYRPVHQLVGSGDPDWERIRAGWFPSFVDVEAFTARVRRGLDDVAGRHGGRSSALVVCHAGVINIYLQGLLGLEAPLTFPLDHTSVTRVLVPHGGPGRVRSVNETQHLGDLG